MITRRSLVTSALLARAGAQPASDPLDLANAPNFCAHEHWGSIESIGRSTGGFRADFEAGALPSARTALADLVFEPYLRGWLASGGADLDSLARARGLAFRELARKSSTEALELARPLLAQHRFTGAYQATRRGILHLYGADIDRLDARAAATLEDEIGKRYERLFEWYRTAMARAGFSALIRPVHPEFYSPGQATPAAREEAAFTHTVMRIDPFLELWKTGSPRRRALAEIAGVMPADAATWRAFLLRFFEIAAQGGANGIKQLQAYTRSLEFLPRQDAEVKWSGELTPGEVTVFQDWVVHECSKLAHERGWPHQVHVGTHNLERSSPLPLARLAARYPRMKLVMIHCWPFLREAGWLAKQHPNIYIDTCWQPVLNPAFFREAIAMWWNYVPAHKITCSQDSTTVEMACGSSLFTREILSEVLRAGSRGMGASETELRALALGYLHNNAVEIYGMGERV